MAWNARRGGGAGGPGQTSWMASRMGVGGSAADTREPRRCGWTERGRGRCLGMGGCGLGRGRVGWLGYLRECPHLRVWRAATTSPPLPAEQRHHRVASQRVLRLRGGGAWFPFASTVWTDGGRMCAPTDMAVGAQRQCTSGARWIGCWSRDNLRDSYTAQFEVGFDI